jgi:hypothetical protein
MRSNFRLQNSRGGGSSDNVIIARAAETRNARRNSRSSGKHDAAISAGGSSSKPPHSAQKVSNASAACHGGCESVFVLDLALLFLFTVDECETGIFSINIKNSASLWLI